MPLLRTVIRKEKNNQPPRRSWVADSSRREIALHKPRFHGGYLIILHQLGDAGLGVVIILTPCHAALLARKQVTDALVCWAGGLPHWLTALSCSKQRYSMVDTRVSFGENRRRIPLGAN